MDAEDEVERLFGKIEKQLAESEKQLAESEKQLKEVAGLLKSKFNFTDTTTISFFHLDKTTLNKYSNETLDHLYNSFK